jgi:hypothetical protein
MDKRIEGRRRRRITGLVLAAAMAVGIGGGGLQAQGRPRHGYRTARNLQLEAELAAMVAQLNWLLAHQRPVTRPQVYRPRVYGPNEGPVNIPVGMPMYGPLTPAQRAVNQMVTGQILGQMASICESRRASQPYSNYDPGRLQPGWHQTVLGPQLNTCR